VEGEHCPDCFHHCAAGFAGCSRGLQPGSFILFISLGYL
jgi:hypothetical protein